MGNTKIINVLKTDTFEEVFQDFQGTDAQEVIFIFPKGSKFNKNSNYFNLLSKEADSTDKTISVMSNDPIIAEFAGEHGINVLTPKARVARKAPAKAKTTPRATTISAKDEEEDIATIPLADLQDEDDKEEKEVAVHDDEPSDDDVDAEDEQENEEEVDETEDAEEESSSQYEPMPHTSSSMSFDEFLHGKQKQKEAVDMPVTHPEEVLADYPETILAAKHYGSRPVRDIVHSEREQMLHVKDGGEKNENIFVSVEKRKSTKAAEADISAMWGEREETIKEKLSPKRSGGRTFSRKLPFIFIGVALVAALSVAYTVMGSAQIIMKPQKQNINFQLKLSASSDATAVNADFTVIPGQKLEDKEEASGTFPATDQKDIVQKAKGTAIIYNKGTTSQKLVATTRLESEKGLIYRIPASVTVPAATKSNGEMVPGQVKTIIYADRPGPDYNITTAQFTIPGFKDTDKYAEFLAKVDQPITGGSSGSSPVVSEDDYSKAQVLLKGQVNTKIAQALAQQGNGLINIASSQIQFDDPGVNAHAGDPSKDLQMTVRGSVTTIGFRQSDITQAIKNYVTKNSGLDLIEKDLKVSYQNPVLSSDKKSLAFTLQVSGQAAHHLDTEKIMKEILGMKEASIQSYFKNMKDVESARILLSPFWVSSIPKDSQKVKITVQN